MTGFRKKFVLEIFTVVIVCTLFTSSGGPLNGNFHNTNFSSHVEAGNTLNESNYLHDALGPSTINKPSNGWEQYQGNASHNGFSNTSNPKTNNIAWTYNEGGSLDGMVANSGTLIVSNPDNGPYIGLNENNGSLVFVGSAPSGTSNSGSRYPSSGDGMFYGEWYSEGFFSSPAALGADSVYNGEQVWSTGVGDSPSETQYSWSSSALYGGYVIYEMQGSNTLEAFSVATGVEAWASNVQGSLIGIPTLGDNVVLVGYSNLHNITALSLTSGVALWNLQTDGNLSDTPSFSSGDFYFGTTAGSLYSVNIAGNVIWEENFSGVVGTTPVISNGTVYFGDENGYIYALNASTGDTIWSYNSQSSFVSSPAVSSNGFIDEATTSGTVLSLHSSNGSLYWELSLGIIITASPVLNDGFLFLVSTSGTIYAIGTHPTEKYTVTFIENGLPSGVPWYINLSNGNDSGSITGSSYSFSIANGTYLYTIGTTDKTYEPSPSSGPFTVNGASVSESITFNLVTYTVTFIENGLPSGVPWYVNLSNGQLFSSVSNTLSFRESNGTYTFTLYNNGIYIPNPSSGTINVEGSSINQSITFSVVHTIIFREDGLPLGTTWSVMLNGTLLSSSNSTIKFIEPNGSYAYTIEGISGYRTTTYSGIITTNGNSVNENIIWSVILYPMTIIQSGIPTGISWSVTLTGQTFNNQAINVTLSSTNNMITFNEPNGSYSYVVHLPSGYTTNNNKGTMSVSGAPRASSIAVQRVTSTSSNSYLIYAIVAIAVIVAILGALVALNRRKKQ